MTVFQRSVPFLGWGNWGAKRFPGVAAGREERGAGGTPTPNLHPAPPFHPPRGERPPGPVCPCLSGFLCGPQPSPGESPSPPSAGRAGRGHLRSERPRLCRVRPGAPAAEAGDSCSLLPEWPPPQVGMWVRAKSSRRPTYTPLPLGSSGSAPALPSACSTRSRMALPKLAGRTGSLRALSARRNLSFGSSTEARHARREPSRGGGF